MKEKSEKSLPRIKPYQREIHNEKEKDRAILLKGVSRTKNRKQDITYKKTEIKDVKCDSEILCSLNDDEIRSLFSDMFPASWSEENLNSENLEIFRKVCRQYDFSIINEETLFNFSKTLLQALFPKHGVGKYKVLVGIFFMKRNKQKMNLFLQKVKEICRLKNKDDSNNRITSEERK